MHRLPIGVLAALTAVLGLAAPASAALQLKNQFVSSKGWVKPGGTFPLTVTVTNPDGSAADGGTVTIEPVPGMSFSKIELGDGASIAGGAVEWDVGSVPAGGERRIVIEAKADTLGEDPEVVWKDLSTTATGSVGSSASHGPKVIPPSETYETARYGDRPFPVVPVDFLDRKHDPESSAELLASTINDPENPGSTFNLFQEMSYGQLFPQADVPSVGVESAGWDYQPGFAFTKRVSKLDTCIGLTAADLPGAAPYTNGNPDRINDGWYQLPGTTDYYGDDSNGSAVIGAQVGVGALQSIDSGCGPAAKAVYDAATIADPDIDYDDFDTDKDGVVDFFMMIFPGVGGNGESQLSQVPPYDNIWPHSSSLEDAYVDRTTGLGGYVSDDQATDRLGRPLWYTDDSYTKRTTQDTGDALKAYTRVGPYNVNPETAIDKASVISHEYGHSLGLPDFYSTGSRETYGTWTLMGEDRSQHIDIFGRQDLGWVVPELLPEGTTEVADFKDSSTDTHRITWRRPDGKPYTLEGPGVHNGQAYMAKLPARQIIAPDKVPSGSHVYWSQAGSDFGCPPLKGRNMDIALPALRDVPAGTPITLRFKSSFEIEWDYDYAFVMTTTDGGKTYRSHPSAKGFTTPASQNPNSNPCQGRYGNGLTGSSDVHANGVPALARVLGDYGESVFFVDDEYDLSSLAGQDAVLRFSYATDPALAKKGWFIDDIQVLAGDTVIYSSDVESATDTAVFQGGCREGLQTALVCTKGWQYVSSVDGSTADHGYYIELRDRAGFDADGHGEDDRGNGPTFQPGLSLVYTDENHGYGNTGVDDPPAQSPLDAVPEPGSEAPNLDDAGFTAAEGRNAFSDAPPGRVDNYTDPTRSDEAWRFDFDCLGFSVKSMTGQEVGPPTVPGDLRADVAFTRGAGCADFDFGYGGAAAGAPVPDAEKRCPAHSKAAGAAARPRGGGMRFRGKGRVRVAVVRRATARRPVKARTVFRGSGRGGVTWSGAGATDGTYVARVRAAKKVRQVVLRRVLGRFRIEGAFARTSKCGFVRRFKLSSPAVRRDVRVSYRLARRARVALVVLRGKKVVRTIEPRSRAANRTHRKRLRLGRPGVYTVVLRAKAGDRGVNARLVTRRL